MCYECFQFSHAKGEKRGHHPAPLGLLTIPQDSLGIQEVFERSIQEIERLVSKRYKNQLDEQTKKPTTEETRKKIIASVKLMAEQIEVQKESVKAQFKKCIADIKGRFKGIFAKLEAKCSEVLNLIKEERNEVLENILVSENSLRKLTYKLENNFDIPRDPEKSYKRIANEASWLNKFTFVPPRLALEALEESIAAIILPSDKKLVTECIVHRKSGEMEFKLDPGLKPNKVIVFERMDTEYKRIINTKTENSTIILPVPDKIFKDNTVYRVCVEFPWQFRDVMLPKQDPEQANQTRIQSSRKNAKGTEIGKERTSQVKIEEKESSVKLKVCTDDKELLENESEKLGKAVQKEVNEKVNKVQDKQDRLQQLSQKLPNDDQMISQKVEQEANKKKVVAGEPKPAEAVQFEIKGLEELEGDPRMLPKNVGPFVRVMGYNVPKRSDQVNNEPQYRAVQLDEKILPRLNQNTGIINKYDSPITQSLPSSSYNPVAAPSHSNVHLPTQSRLIPAKPMELLFTPEEGFPYSQFTPLTRETSKISFHDPQTGTQDTYRSFIKDPCNDFVYLLLNSFIVRFPSLEAMKAGKNVTRIELTKPIGSIYFGAIGRTLYYHVQGTATICKASIVNGFVEKGSIIVPHARLLDECSMPIDIMVLQDNKREELYILYEETTERGIILASMDKITLKLRKIRRMRIEEMFEIGFAFAYDGYLFIGLEDSKPVINLVVELENGAEVKVEEVELPIKLQGAILHMQYLAGAGSPSLMVVITDKEAKAVPLDLAKIIKLGKPSQSLLLFPYTSTRLIFAQFNIQQIQGYSGKNDKKLLIQKVPRFHYIIKDERIQCERSGVQEWQGEYNLPRRSPQKMRLRRMQLQVTKSRPSRKGQQHRYRRCRMDHFCRTTAYYHIQRGN
eukprot:TRINITY_DN142_c0_g1_i1.p1 TRINITY_DN142_c0_g1~~TRINITY_DN142_c0_g1_i1.p1  ORF type:complete len:903 (-),score=72.69 TRINITY_DN142_c0_g1_i1:8659-11367(-)